MNWTTLYITGRGNFRDDIRRKLDASDLDFMPGYVDTSSSPRVYDLCWIYENTDLKSVKKAIGSKLIWKYRLRFYLNLEDFIQSVNDESKSNDFTDEEQTLLEAMREAV